MRTPPPPVQDWRDLARSLGTPEGHIPPALTPPVWTLPVDEILAVLDAARSDREAYHLVTLDLFAAEMRLLRASPDLFESSPVTIALRRHGIQVTAEWIRMISVDSPELLGP